MKMREVGVMKMREALILNIGYEEDNGFFLGLSWIVHYFSHELAPG